MNPFEMIVAATAGLVVGLVGLVCRLFSNPPMPTNDTVSEIEGYIKCTCGTEDSQFASRRQAEADRQRAEYQQRAEMKRREKAEHAERLRAASDQLASKQSAEEQQRAEYQQRAEMKRREEDEHAERLRAASDQLASKQSAEEQHQAQVCTFRRRAERRASEKRAEEVKLAARLKVEEERFGASQRAAKRPTDEKFSAKGLKPKGDRLASQQREQDAMKAAKDARIALQRSIQPIEWPTREEYDAAMKWIEYDPKKLHFAVFGVSGSGKSSLVNAFRGLTINHSSAAKVGVTETTSTIRRYPDLRQEFPYSRFVWYDIPGAGTLKVRDWQYFNQQGLFVFDFVIVVYDTRFTTTDVGIIENCNRFRIPVFIVRSKADQHVANMLAMEDEIEPCDPGYEKLYQKKMDKFILETRSNFSEQTKLMKEESKDREQELDKSDPNYARECHFESSYQQWLSKQVVYIVSYKKLRTLVSTYPKSFDDPMHTDEMSLFEDLLSAAAVRRYSSLSTNSKDDVSLLKTLALSVPAMMCNRRSTPDSWGS